MIDSFEELFPFSTPVLTGAYASDSARKLSETLRRRTQSCDQIWKNFAINQPMTSKAQHSCKLMHR